MSYVSSRKSGSLGGLTLPEMVIALAIAGIVFAVILPQLRVIQNSWDSREGASETLQNGRVLMDHLHRNLSRAARITAVSGPSETDGHIEFQASDGNNMRYDIAGDNYVEFGIVGSLADLAGPVSRLQFTCYNAFDLTTPVTDVNSIRCVKVQATLTNPAAMDQDMSFTTQAYIRTNALPAAGGDISKKSEPWPEFDPASGKTPALCRIDSTHYLCAYGGEGDDGWAVVLTVNSDDRSVTAETPFEFDTSNGLEPALARLDDTHFLCAYRGDGDDGWVVVLTVNTANWTISAETPFEYDAADGWTPALSRIDDQHFLCAYEGPGTDGWAVALTVDTGNWTITAETPFEFDVTKCTRPALAAIDDNYFLCAYQGDGDDGWAVVLRILPGYGVSAEIPFEFDTVDGRAPALFPIDNEHYLCVYEGDGSDGWRKCWPLILS